MGDKGNLPQSLPSEEKGQITEERARKKKQKKKRGMKGALSLNSGKAKLQCNQKLREVKDYSGMHPQS